MPLLLLFLRALVIVICITACGVAKGQANLLRNGGFEQIEIDTNAYLWVNSEMPKEPLNDTAIGWNFSKRQMVIIYSLDWNFGNYDWHSNMTYYSDSGYSHTGKCFALIMPYTIEPYQRLEIHNLCGKLCMPLVAGHKYKVSFFIKAFEGNFFTNQISVAFAESYTDNIFALEKSEITKTGKEVPLSKAYTVPGILDNKEYKQFSFQYTAKGGEQYIYIGNFHVGYMLKKNSQPTGWFSPMYTDRGRPYISYAIDDIVVEPFDTSEGCIKERIKNDAKAPPLIEPDTIQLPGIYFGYDDSVAAGVFEKIADTLKQKTAYHKILLYGFTDNAGSLQYNQQLSLRRAQFVARKLGVLTDKIIIAEGRGVSDTPTNAQLQRRVDIYLIK